MSKYKQLCLAATAPININKANSSGSCDLKCDYKFGYKSYSPIIKNKENYLSLNYTGSTNPVVYNNIEMNVIEIRIYTPSLHQFNGIKTDGEILIIHNGNSTNLIVSIPFIKGNKSDSGSELLNHLISEASLTVPNTNEEYTLNISNFNLSKFIPVNKPYFSYTGTAPYVPCNGSYDYIVFDTEFALNLSDYNLQKLKNIISSPETKIKNNAFFYNKNGAQNKNNVNLEEIYIDCQPVDEEGNVLVNQDLEGTIKSQTNLNVNWEKIEPFFYVIGGVVIASSIIYVGKHVFQKYIKSNSTISS
jgi:carbonic anhydrase